MSDIPRDTAVKALWEAGLISWKFHPAQIDIYEAINRDSHAMFIMNCGRQIGKSFFLCGYAIEFALQHPNCKIAYLAPTAKQVKKIILPRIKEILMDCPKHLLPTYSINEQVYKFKNGSEIHISGTDSERAESLRGQVFHLVICDEAGFMDRLEYVVASILRPLTITVNGKIILSSTPPISPDHPFKRMAEQAELDGNYIKKTIKDNPMISDEIKRQYMKEAGGADSISWRREFLAEFLIDENEAILPEANETKITELTKTIVPYLDNTGVMEGQVMRPMFFDCYTVADLGYTDNTGILFGYWDFPNARLVVEDEALFNKPNTQKIAEVITQKEYVLWGEKKPYMRYCDGDQITVSDLNSRHNLNFTLTRNDELEASINNVRLFIAQNKIYIDPRCKNLISQLKSAIWNKNRKGFARSADSGHYDLVAALIYMVRNVKVQKNPFPANLGLNIDHMYIPHIGPSHEPSKNLHKAIIGEPFKKFFPNAELDEEDKNRKL